MQKRKENKWRSFTDWYPLLYPSIHPAVCNCGFEWRWGGLRWFDTKAGWTMERYRTACVVKQTDSSTHSGTLQNFRATPGTDLNHRCCLQLFFFFPPCSIWAFFLSSSLEANTHRPKHICILTFVCMPQVKSRVTFQSSFTPTVRCSSSASISAASFQHVKVLFCLEQPSHDLHRLSVHCEGFSPLHSDSQTRKAEECGVFCHPFIRQKIDLLMKASWWKSLSFFM